jgi:hypothetical protein
MPDLTASRTLVKSPPELWNELSEVQSLARHIGELGEIKITKVEPERRVAWEGERATGTVQLEPSGWGTTVTFTASVPPDPEMPAPTTTRRGVFNRLFPGFWVQQAEPEPDPPAAASPPDEEQLRAVLDGALDALGSAHHRPFSRG